MTARAQVSEPRVGTPSDGLYESDCCCKSWCARRSVRLSDRTGSDRLNHCDLCCGVVSSYAVSKLLATCVSSRPSFKPDRMTPGWLLAVASDAASSLMPLVQISCHISLEVYDCLHVLQCMPSAQAVLLQLLLRRALGLRKKMCLWRPPLHNIR